VLAEAGFDPNVVTLVAHPRRRRHRASACAASEIKLIDFTGSSAHGTWLERNAHQAQV
jgi:acyl-CoA reductase-like NAD-dependent aldehyde dehydrogenase